MSKFSDDLMRSLDEAAAHVKGKGPALVHAPIEPHELHHSAALHSIIGRLNVHYIPADVQNWLYSIHPQLAGCRAIDLIVGGSAETVIAIIDRLDDEAYL